MLKRATGVLCLAVLLALPAVAADRESRTPNKDRDTTPIERLVQKIIRRVVRTFGDFPILPPPAPNP